MQCWWVLVPGAFQGKQGMRTLPCGMMKTGGNSIWQNMIFSFSTDLDSRSIFQDGDPDRKAP